MNTFTMKDIIKYVHSSVKSLNDSKYMAGLCMIILNVGSKYITIELSQSQEDYIKNTIGRQLLLFSIAWMGTRDVYTSLILTALFVVLTQYLFNENSSFCVLPKSIQQLHSELDTNKDNIISEKELNHAIEVLKRAHKK